METYMMLPEEEMTSINQTSLRSVLDGAPSRTEGLALFAALCRALQAEGLALFDLSPEKIFRGQDGAFYFSSPSAEVPEDGRWLPGAPGYLAPERLRGENAPSFGSDIFSMGAILYEVLTGRRAFLGKSAMMLSMATLDGKFIPPREIAPDCPLELDALCRRMLASSLEERPASLLGILDLLAPFLMIETAPTQAPAPPKDALKKESDALAQTMEPPSKPGSGSGSSIPNRAMELPPLAPTLESKPSEPRAGSRGGLGLVLPVTSEERYHIEGEIARGGLGKITRANDRQMRRQVAIKETLKQVPGDAEQRFFREAFITAKLEHPSIIPIHELGRWSNGSAYYTMKLVSGQSFEKTIAGASSLRERLALLPHVLAACEAMAYAHSQRVIHRDLKPHNILVGPFGETLVIDWGIAKETGNREQGTGNGPEETAESEAPYRSESEEGELTKEGSILGTPAYMPLEQAQGASVDARADVYSLGAILYHLLTGKPPYVGRRSIAVLRSLLDGPPEALTTKEPGAPRELVDIVEKAMAREASERYATAKELAEDLKKYLTGQLVGAHRYTFAEMLRRWVRENRRVLGVAVMGAVLMGVGAVYSVNRIVKERDIARSERTRADEKAASEKKAREAAERAEAAKTKLAKERTLDLARATLETDPAKALTYVKSLTQFPGFEEWGQIRTLTADALSRGVPEFLSAEWRTEGVYHKSKVNWVEYSRDGRMLASADNDGQVILWELATKKGRALAGHTGPVYTVRFSPDGKMLASAGEDGDVRLWEVESGASRVLKGHSQRVTNIKFSPDGVRLASVGLDASARLWTVATGESFLLVGHLEAVLDVDFSPDGERLATSSFDSTVRLWSTRTGESKVLAGHENLVARVRFLPSGEHLVSAGFDNQAIIWEVTTGRAVRSLRGKNEADWFKSLEVNGDSIAVGSSTGDVYLWRAADCVKGDCAGVRLSGHKGFIYSLSFSSDGKLLASGGADKEIRLWDLVVKKELRVLRGHQGNIWGLAFSLDGKTLVSGSEDSRVCFWSVSELEQGAYYEESPVYAIAYSPDGSLLVSGDQAGTLTVRDREGTILRRMKEHKGLIYAMSFSSDGVLLASADQGGSLVVQVAGTGEVLWRETTEGLSYSDLRFSSDGKKLFVAAKGEGLIVWDVVLQQKTSLPGILAEAFDVNPDGGSVIWTNTSPFIYLSARGGKELQRLPQPSQNVRLQFSPGGKWLAASGIASFISLWLMEGASIPTTEPIRLSGHRGAVGGLSFSSSGRSLVSASDDGTARIWELNSRESRPLLGRGAPMAAVAFSPDEKQIAFAGDDNVIQLAADDLPWDGPSLVSFLESRESPP